MYIVRTKEIEPTVEIGQKEYFDSIPHSENIDIKLGNRFPFECLEKSKLEVYEVGSKKECQNFIENNIPQEVRDYFTYEEYKKCD